MSQVLVERASGERTRYLYGLDLLGQIQGGTPTYLGYDALSVRLHVNNSGEIESTYRYGPFGEAVGEGVSGPGYSGEIYDAEPALLYLRARYYAPAVGRFVSRDRWAGTSQQPQTLHRFVYVTNDPINGYDPSGLEGKIPRPVRLRMLSEVGKGLGAYEGGDSLKKFIALVDLAAVLALNNRDDFMLDTTCVILGVCFDDEKECTRDLWKLGFDDIFGTPGNTAESDRYKLWVNVFRQQGSWASRYYDYTYGQMYHFWFFVSDSYFESGPGINTALWAWGGNALHESFDSGGSKRDTAGCRGIDPLTEKEIDICDKGVDGEFLGKHKSLQDWRLGNQGADLGDLLRRELLRPSEVGRWIWRKLSQEGVDHWLWMEDDVKVGARQLYKYVCPWGCPLGFEWGWE